MLKQANQHNLLQGKHLQILEAIWKQFRSFWRGQWLSDPSVTIISLKLRNNSP
jgi:hypothetical protein